MLALVRPAPAGGTLRHPLTQPFDLPASPLVIAAVGAALVLVIALVWPHRGHRRSPDDEADVSSWAGSLSAAQIGTRSLSVALLALAIVAGRVGADDELENLAPALVVGVAWPALVLASVVLGPVWRWVDPWDSLARGARRDGQAGARGSVVPAALIALGWVWYLSAYPRTLAPRSVGGILAFYTLVTVAGCLAMGRVRWLASSEPLGISLSWMARMRGGRLGDWSPPRGAEVLLGVLAGGVLFGAIRRSELWGGLNAVDGALAFSTVGVLGSCAAVAGLFVFLARQGDRAGASGSMVRAAIPAVAGIVVAVAMDRNRLTTSFQLLPGLLGDPFGRGWDLLGRAGAGLDPAPLGATGLAVAQLGVLLAGHVTGALVLARDVRRGTSREPVAIGLAILFLAAVVSIASH